MENEQIMTPDSRVVETPKRCTDVFTEMLDAEESNDKPEVEMKNRKTLRKMLRKLRKKQNPKKK